MQGLRKQCPTMQLRKIPRYPFEEISIDTSGPYPETIRGNRYIISVICNFSSWLEAYATKRKDAETVAEVLLDVISRHSVVRRCLTDQDKAYVGKLTQKIGTSLNIKFHTTCSYTPPLQRVCRKMAWHVDTSTS